MTAQDCETMPADALHPTPFHRAAVNRMESTWWFGWGGYVVPDVYIDPVSELRAIRTSVSMNEMSPIPKMEVRGSGAAACVDYGAGWRRPRPGSASTRSSALSRQGG